MKDWGMLAPPPAAVRYHTEGINNIAKAQSQFINSAQNAGFDAIQSATNHRKELLKQDKIEEEKSMVRRAGELASFASNMEQINKDSYRQLAEQKPKDWRYSWNQTVHPPMQEALASLSDGTREAAMPIAAVYSQRGAIDSQTKYEIDSINQSRNQWKTQLEQSIQSGDAQEAKRWLGLGQEIFVPADQMSDRIAEVESSCLLAQRQAQLQAEPLSTMSQLINEELSPLNEKDQLRFNNSLALAASKVQLELREQLKQDIKLGVQSDPNLIQQAQQAKLIGDIPVPTDKPLELQESQWRSVIDQSPLQELDTRVKLELQLASSSLPSTSKKKLLHRIDQSMELSQSDRRSINRQVCRLYQDGYLGALGDKSSLNRLISQQDEGLEQLRLGGVSQAALWINDRQQSAKRWICYQDTQQQTQTQAQANS